MAADSRVIFSTELDESGLKRGLSRLGSSVGVMAKGMGLALGAVATGLGALAKNGMAYNSQMEQYTTSFTTMLGSASAAQAKVAELKEYAAKTPFEMTDLANATKTILGFGVAEERADTAMKRMGDISQGNAEKFNSLSLVYGQVASTGKLMGQDLLQMINAGFNPLQQIAEKTGASMGDLKAVMSGDKTSKEFQTMVKNAQKEVKKLGENASPAAKMLAQIGTEGVISADLVDQAMQIATEKGGLFYGAMDKQSKTAAGLISTLKDNLNALGGDAFAGLSNAAKEQAIPAALAYVDQMTEALRTGGVKGLVSEAGNVLGSVVGDASTFAPQAINMALGLIQSLVSGLKKNASKIAKGLGETLKAAAIGMLKAVPDMLSTLLEIAMELVSSLADALPEILPELVESLLETFGDLITNVPQLIAIGIKVAAALVIGIVGGIGKLLGSVGDMFTSLFGGVKVNAKEVQDYVDRKTSGYVKAYSDTKTKIDELKTSINGGLAENDTDLDKAMALVEALEEMGNPKDLNESQLAQYKAIVEQLKTDWPDLAPYIGKNGLFKQDTDAIREHIKELAKEKELEYLLGKLPEAKEAQAQAQKDLDERKAAILEEITLLKEKESIQKAIESIREKAANAITQSTNSSSPDEDAKVIQNTKSLLDEYVKAGGTLESIKSLLVNPEDINVSSFSSATDVLSAFQKLATDGSLQTDIASIQSAIDTLTNGGTTAEGVTIPALSALVTQCGEASGVVTGLQTQIDALYEVPEGEETPDKKTRSIKTNVDGDITETGKALDDAKTSLHDKAVAVRDSITSGLTGGESGGDSETEAGTSGDIAGAGSSIIDQFAKGMEDNDSIKGVIKNKVLASVSNARIGTWQPAYSVGQYLVSGIAAGASSKSGFLNVTLTKIIKDAVDAAKKAAGINSPSRLFRDQVGAPIAAGIEVGITGRMTGVLAAISKSVAESAQAGKAALDNTLLGRVQSIAGIGYAYPSTGAVSAGIMRGSALLAYGSAGTPGEAGTTIYAPQTINFNREMQAPDEIARSIRRQTTYGLAGARR